MAPNPSNSCLINEDHEILNFINGPNVSLVNLRNENVEQLIRWANDPEIRVLTGSHFSRTFDSVKKQLEDADAGTQKADNIWFGIWHGADQALIGEASLIRINWPSRSANFTITIGEKTYWNRGLGTEVGRLLLDYGFKELQFHKIKAFFLSENAGSGDRRDIRFTS